MSLDFRLNFLIVFIIIVLFSSCAQNSKQIIISKQSIINETGYGKVMHWFDEQDTTLNPKTMWETPGLKSYWPAGIVLDLGNEYHISSIKFFDGEISDKNISNEFEHQGGKIIVSGGTPFNFTKKSDYKLTNSGKWSTIKIDIETRYLQIKKEATKQYFWKEYGPFQCDVNIYEVIIEGYPTGKKVRDIPVPIIRKTPFTFDEYIGANSYMWIPDSISEAVGFIREYHLWSWNGVKNIADSIDWNNNDELGSFDEYYKRTSENNKFDVCVDIHRHVDEANYGKSKPSFGGDPTDPLSYKLIADYLFQYVARYGNSKVPDSLLRVKEGNAVISGMGWMTYYENWNEPDKWWGESEYHFTPYELSAMLSASYDGHLGKLGSTFGIKQADKYSKQVVGGLTTIDLDYIKAMKYWSDYHRNGSFPADVINFHHYNNTAGIQRAGEKVYGISPEADNFREKLENLSQWRDENMPETELWLSEFGWDTDENSTQCAIGHEQYPDKISMVELQAMWLIRGYLIGAAARIDRVMMFLINDLKGNGTFNSSGLIDVEGNKKLSWYYVASLKHILDKCKYEKDINSNHPNIRIYKFKDTAKDREVYALWCTTSDGTYVENYKFNVDGEVKEISEISLIDKSDKGRSEVLQMNGDKTIDINVSETPVFIQISY